MYVHSVKLVNYKSFGDYNENEVIIEPRITAIIGKNESGKSNVLDGLSRIWFRGRNQDAFQPNIVNRDCSGPEQIKYLVTLKPTAEEQSLGIQEDTVVEIIKDGYRLTGGVLLYYRQAIQPDVEQIMQLLGSMNSNAFQLRDTALNNYQIYYKELCTAEAIDVPRRISAFKFISDNADKIAAGKREALKTLIESAIQKWNALLAHLPVFYYRSADKSLYSQYKYEDIEKELTGKASYPNSLLKNFVKIIGVSVEDFLSASKSGTAGKQETIRRKIGQLVEQKINAGFRDFYSTEEIRLGISFNGGVVSFGVESNTGAYLQLSERSNGLRWYLNTYIDALANDTVGKNTVYLFDEPGTALHVNAQRELIRLMGDLADKGNQIVYATHSPYMLDLQSEGYHRIRAVVKSKDGFSYVYKTAYDSRIAPESQQDTLTPIIHALGMNLYDSLGPATGKVNIVPEGMSDYIFINTFAKQFDLDMEKYAIIPSVGAANCVNICMILHGWECPYKAVFDYDLAGAESGGEYLRQNMFLEYKKDYCYVADVSEEDIIAKTYKTNKIMIEDVVGREEINRFLSETGISSNLGKPLTAKLMCTAIENGSFHVSQDCMDRMQELIMRITNV